MSQSSIAIVAKDKIIESDVKLRKKFKFMQKLSESPHSIVYKVENLQKEEVRALKISFYSKIDKMGIMKENLVLKRLGKTYFPDHFSAGSWTYGHYIEMELLKTNLNQEIKYKKYQVNQIEDLTFQALNMLEILHSTNIIHRNINPNNLMKRFNDNLVLIDFSQALKIKKLMDTSLLIQDTIPRQQIGFSPFLSLNGHKQEPLTKKDDVQSLLYTMYYVYKKSLPWYGKNFSQKKSKIYEMKNKQSLKMFESLSFSFFQAYAYIKKLKPCYVPNYSYLKGLFKKYNFTSQNASQNPILKSVKIKPKYSEKAVKFEADSGEEQEVIPQIKIKAQQSSIVICIQSAVEMRSTFEGIEQKKPHFKNLHNYESVKFKNPFFQI